MLVLLAQLALADTITLETGVTIEGDLARYEMGGDCQVSVTEGDLQGVIVIVPCHRIAAFVRAPREAPVLVGLVEPAGAKPSPAVAEPAKRYAPDPFDAAEAAQSRREAAAALAIVDQGIDHEASDTTEAEDLAWAEAELPAAAPVVESSDDPPYGPDGDDDQATTQPHLAPSMPAVTTRPISF